MTRPLIQNEVLISVSVHAAVLHEGLAATQTAMFNLKRLGEV